MSKNTKIQKSTMQDALAQMAAAPPPPMPDPSSRPASEATSTAATTTDLRSVHVQLTADMHRRLKIVAADRGLTVREIATKALTDWIERNGLQAS